MLVNEYLKAKKSPKVKQLVSEAEDIETKLTERKEDFTEIFELFPQIFKKLHPRRKVLDIGVSQVMIAVK